MAATTMRFDDICEIYDNINFPFYSICLKEVTKTPVSFSTLCVESSGKSSCAGTTTRLSTSSFFSPGNGLKRRTISRSVSDRRLIVVSSGAKRKTHVGASGEPAIKRRHTDNNEGGSGEGKLTEEEETEEEVDFEDENIMEAVQRLQECLAEDNLGSLMKVLTLEDGIPEEQLQVAIGIHLVQKLAGKAYANHSITGVKCPCGCSGSVPAGDMWIGSSETWHGELDLLGGDKATSLFLRTVDDGSEDADENDSDGNHTNVEIKKTVPMQGYSRCPIFAQAIVFGWTEYNRHPDLCPNIPTLAVGNGKIIPYIYNPVTDELLTTRGYIDILDKVLTKQHIVVIWALLHHRLFFSKNWIKEIHPSNFQAYLPDSLVDKYKSLVSFQSKEIRPKASDFYAQTASVDCFM